MKGALIILMLLALLVTGYLVAQDMEARKGTGKGTGKGTIDAVEKAEQVKDKVRKAQEASEKRIMDLVKE